MFKKFIVRIIRAKNRDDAWETVFYGPDGINQAYQQEKITWAEYELLTALLDKLAE